MNKVRADTSNSLQYLIWLKSKTVKMYSVVQSVKLLLVLSIFKFLEHLPYIIYFSDCCLYSAVSLHDILQGQHCYHTETKWEKGVTVVWNSYTDRLRCRSHSHVPACE